MLPVPTATPWRAGRQIQAGSGSDYSEAPLAVLARAASARASLSLRATGPARGGSTQIHD